jgi:hypothetical protein
LEREVENQSESWTAERLSPAEIQRLAREKWLEFRAGQGVAKETDR